jgi:multidrug efflux pump
MSRRSGSEQESSGGGGLARYFVEHREVGWIALIAVLIWGAVSFRLLPQQEDPALPGRIARVVCVLPGATAAKVEELVTRRLEKKISELETMEEMSSETRANVAILTLGQRPDRFAKVEQEWDKLRAKLAEVPLPDGCLPPQLQTDFGDVTTLLLAVTSASAGDYRPLATSVKTLEEELQQISSVGRTRQIGAVSATVQLLFSPGKLHEHGLSLARVTEALKLRHQFIPSGALRGADTNLPVQVSGEFTSAEALGDAIIGAGRDGQPIRLAEVLDVRHGDADPLPFHVDVLRRPPDGGALGRQRSVLLAVEMKSGQVIGEFATAVSDAIARVKPQFAAGVDVLTISDQPRSVERRIGHFSRCFGEAVLIVIVVSARRSPRAVPSQHAPRPGRSGRTRRARGRRVPGARRSRAARADLGDQARSRSSRRARRGDAHPRRTPPQHLCRGEGHGAARRR